MSHPRMDRRRVLELAGAAAGAAVVGCSGLTRGDLAESMIERSNLDPPIAELLADAALAPSSHNSQPWRVVVEAPDRLAVYADLERALPEVDPARRELRLSLGAFVENLVTAAGARGFAAELEPADRDDLTRPVTTVRLARTTPSRSSLAVLRRRCTVRRGLRTTPLPGDLVTYLAASSIMYVDAREPLAAVLRDATLEAFRQQTARDAAQRELARWIRFRDDDARTSRDGLTMASMGVTGLSGWYVRHFYDSDDVMSRKFRARGIDAAAEQVTSAGGWFVIASPDAGPAALLDAGRTFERLALRACERGVGLHPMSQALEEEPYRAQLAARLGGVPQFIVRAGLVDDYPQPVTLRRPVRAFAARAAG